MIVALLSFYDETPAMLDQCIRSLEGAVDRLIALDGAYALYPGGTAKSPSPQQQTIIDAAEEVGITGQVVTPATVWAGQEIEKRNHLFALGEAETTSQDWYMVIDADETLTRFDPELHDWLTDSVFHVAQITLREYNGHTSAHRMYFRALRGLHVGDAHYHYLAPNPTGNGNVWLWGDSATWAPPLAPALDLTATTVVQHHARPKVRHDKAQTYYKQRDDQHLERNRYRPDKEAA